MILESKQLLDFLDNIGFKNSGEIKYISKGYFSKAYSFESKNKDYILRIGTSLKAFKKDILAFQQFSRYLPIPEIYKTGEYENNYFCISEKFEGITFNILNNDIQEQSLDSLIQSHQKMLEIDCNIFNGFGSINENGSSNYQSWKEFITDIAFDNHLLCPEDMIYKNWQIIFKTENVDIELITTAQKILIELSEFCPEEKHLIHGDFGGDNLIIKNNYISAIIDWAEMIIGDSLYDIAYLDFYSENINYSQIFKDFYKSKNIEFINYEQRINCYKIYECLKSIFVSINRHLREFYLEDIEKLKKLIKELN